MTNRRLVKLDDFVKEPTTYNRFGEKVTKTPIERIANGGLLSNYKQLSTNAKYIKFTGMLEPNDGGEGMYIQDDTITDEEDIGVIIYIGEHKYRRLYAAWVNIDWFYLGDFATALQRACNYNSVRGTTGKIYECKTEITLQINANSIGNHGMVDYGHKLIDMRGATVNFTNEEALYCFNIRIYHRDTKFMFTNCNFNVTDNNIGLVNIANIIGSNNYTDMLTDNIYNVSKDKLPDTNTVVLVDKPEIEGIKTFEETGQLNYIGEALSANDNQAVTKEYKPADYDETAYVSLKDTRKLAGLTTFKDIFDRDQGNIVLQSKINDYILDTLNIKLSVINNNLNLSIYYILSYYITISNTNNPTNILSGNWILQNYLSNIGYVYKLLPSDTYIVVKNNIMYTETEINLPVYIQCNINKSITIAFDKLEPEQDELATAMLERHCREIPSDLMTKQLPAQFSMRNVTNLSSNPEYKKITHIYAIQYDTETYDRYLTNACLLACYTTENKIILLTGFNYANNNFEDYWYNNNLDCILYRNARTTDTWYIDVNTSEVEILDLRDNKIKYLYGIPATIYKIKNFPVDVQSINIIGSQYVAINNKVEIYIKDYTIIDDNNINIDTFYIKCATLLQANLRQFNTVNDTQPCSQISLALVYNKELITTRYCNIYIARFISTGHNNYEYMPHISNNMTNSYNRYVNDIVFINNTFSKLSVYYQGIPTVTDRWYGNAAVCYNLNSFKHNHNIVTTSVHKTITGECETSNAHNCGGAHYEQYTLSTIYSSSNTISGFSALLGACALRHTLCRDTTSNIFFTTSDNLINYCYTSVNGKQSDGCNLVIVGGVYSIAKYNTNNRGIFIFTQPHCVKNVDIDEYYIIPKSFIYQTGVHATYNNATLVTVSASVTNSCDGGNLSQYINPARATGLYLSSFGFITSMYFIPYVLDRVFGTKIIDTAYILRDGILTDPFRNRGQLPEHQFALPVHNLANEV